MFRTEGLDHIAILVRDVKASALWYQDVLALERFHEQDWGDYPAVVGTGTSSIALFPVAGEKPKPRPGRDTIAMRHFAFRVTRPNLESAKQRLTSRGITFTEQNHQVAESIYFFDPDGHEIELTTYEL
jgi:catechol 2,3-dioxygenase-like lactoylglutathione lyase family enzyme